MKIKPGVKIWSLPITLAFISFGCGWSGLMGSTDPTPTRQVAMLPTFTPTLELVVVQPTATTETQPPTEQPVEPTPTFTPLPPTPEPTQEAEPQNNGLVTATVNQNMNVRGGPGTNYPVLGTAPAGASSAVVGRNSDSSWLQVEYPPGTSNTGWVFAQLVTVSGNMESVAVAQAPPPPAPAPQPAAQQEAQPQPQPEAKKYQFTPGAWHASQNEAICHFRGTIRDEGGNPVHGYSVLVDNGSYSVISHPSSASHHYPEKVDGEWDVSGIPLKDCVGWWTLTVVRYDCPDFQTRFEAQCKQYSPLSEGIKIEVDYPKHTVIWADWTCHWDCDKGVYNTPYRR